MHGISTCRKLVQAYHFENEECTAKGTHDGKKKRDSFYQHQEAGKQEKNQMGLLTIDDWIITWGEHTELRDKYAIMVISSSDQEAQILAYSQAVKKLEAQLVTFQKQQLSLNEKLTFQANEIYEKDEKLKKYRRIGMKAVKEKEQLQKILDSYKDSSKNLWRLINSCMSSNNKLGLGYEIQSNNEVLSVPHPLSGDYTPTPQEEIDEYLYVYGKKGPQEPEPSVSDDRSSEYSTCQSNDSEGSIGTSSEHSVDPESEISRVPQEVYVSKPITTNEKGEGYSFTKKKCFVCGSLSYLIKDCDYYEKKMAREAEFKKQRVFNTGNGVAKPVWTNANRVNHANQFILRSVQLNAGRPNINSVRPNINTGRTNLNSVRPNINTGRTNINSVRPNTNNGRTNINSVRPNIDTGRVNVNSVRPNINTGRINVNSVRPNVNTGRVNVNSVKSNVNTGRVNVNFVRPNVNTGRVNVNSVRPNVNTGRVNVNSVRPNVNTGRVNVNSIKSNVNTGRTNVNHVRPKVNTGRVNVNSVRPNVNIGKVNVNSVRPNINTGRVNVKGPQGRPKPVKVWVPTRN
ncbi:hypothetical protein Tco_0513664 [Tanacetum coccineum]